MSERLKAGLLCAVLITLFALGEAMGVPPLSTPGYLVVGTFRQLPDPYPTRPGVSVPHRTAVSVVSDLFWASLLCAWIVIGQNQRRRQEHSR